MNAHDNPVGLQNPQRLCLQEFGAAFFMKIHDVFCPKLQRVEFILIPYTYRMEKFLKNC